MSVRTSALNNLTTSLAQAGRFPEAYAVANDIHDDKSRANTLSALAVAFAQARLFSEARTVTDAIPDDRIRAEAFSTLAVALARAGLIYQSVAVLTDLWHHAQTCDELLSLFIIPPELLHAYPQLGKAFHDSFTWVDAQLVFG